MKTPAILSLLYFLFIISEFQCKAQIQITNGSEVTPEDLVEKIVGDGVIVDNITFQGAEESMGIFKNGLSANLGIDEGIFLSSGDGDDIPGPNISQSSSTNFGGPGHPTLNQLCNCLTFDAAVLEFDFVPAYDTLKINYTFGSDEYPESSNFTGIDPVGIFITGPKPDGGYYNDENITLVPGTSTRVAIHTINQNTNSEYYIDNTNGMFLEYDGFTVVLEATLPVYSCVPYHIRIAVSDGGDQIIDSGIFLEENSITSPAISTSVLLDPPGLTENMVEGHVNATLVFRLPDTNYAPVTINFEIEGTATNGIDYEEIPNHVTFEEGQDSVSFPIVPLFDGYIEGYETIILIIENTLGCETVFDTLELIIEDYVALTDIISPPTITCQGCEVTLWVEVFNGYPPYTYYWEPGGFTTDSITVAPDTITTYYVTYSDLFGETGLDSTKVTVFPTTQFSSFSFEAGLNPGLPFDVIGEFSNDTINLHLPGGTNLQNLVASYTLTGEYISISVNGEVQEPGITPNDFTAPVIYTILAPGGMVSQWIVIADIETNLTQHAENAISIFPNPAKDQITTSNANGWKFTMLNTMGKTVLKGSISNQNQSISISDLKSGLYFLKFQKADKVFVKRLVICR